jgi:hypothetical protein
MRSLVTHEELLRALHYNPATGVFTWLVDRGSNLCQGQIAGSYGDRGYLTICINYRRYYGHRLAFFYMTGRWPNPEVDHEDLDKSNNRWSNLREATRPQNAANRSRQSNNTSGFIGVTKSRRGWQAQIGHHGRCIYVGTFSSIEDAVRSRAAKALEIHGEFGASQ